MTSFRRPRVAIAMLSVVVLAGVAGACAPPPSAPIYSGFTQLCPTASGFPIADVFVTIVTTDGTADLAATIDWNLADDSDGGQGVYNVMDPVAGQYTELLIAKPDPGLCLRINGGPGLTYQLTVTWNYDPANYLLWVNGALHPGVIWGSTPL